MIMDIISGTLVVLFGICYSCLAFCIALFIWEEYQDRRCTCRKRQDRD